MYIRLIPYNIIILALDIFDLASPDVLTNITLAVLALVVSTSLSTRESLEELSKKLTKAQSADDLRTCGMVVGKGTFQELRCIN